MGTTFYHATNYKNGKVDRKAECDKILEYVSETRQQRVLKSSMVGSTYYAAVETIREGSREVWAAVFITYGQDRSDPYYNFGYKDMEESMGPYYYDCPKGILDLLTPTDNECANDWRRKCREKKEKKSSLASVKIGEKVKWSPYPHRDGQYRILTKHAPAYQFRTWFWFDEELHTYVQKKLVNDSNTEILAV